MANGCNRVNEQFLVWCFYIIITIIISVIVIVTATITIMPCVTLQKMVGELVDAPPSDGHLHAL